MLGNLCHILHMISTMWEYVRKSSPSSGWDAKHSMISSLGLKGPDERSSGRKTSLEPVDPSWRKEINWLTRSSWSFFSLLFENRLSSDIHYHIGLHINGLDSHKMMHKLPGSRSNQDFKWSTYTEKSLVIITGCTFSLSFSSPSPMSTVTLSTLILQLSRAGGWDEAARQPNSDSELKVTLVGPVTSIRWGGGPRITNKFNLILLSFPISALVCSIPLAVNFSSNHE